MIENPAPNSKPALDEEAFTRLLAAAYVMQEHQDRVRAKVTPADLTQIIAQVVETQHDIQSHALRGDTALDLIAKRLSGVTGTAGVVIAEKTGANLRYRSGAGSGAALVGSEIAVQGTLGTLCFKTGTTFQRPLAQTDPRLNATQCRKLGAQSLLAVPLYLEGQVAGVIEMYFSQVSGFGDSETRAAELMAGLASEVLADAAEEGTKEQLEAERASVKQALEMLGPELQKMADEEVTTQPALPEPQQELCRACGHSFAGNETSCGACGASRETGMYPGAALQSKWAVLWERHLTGAEQDGMPLFRKSPPKETVASSPRLPFTFHGDVEPLEGKEEPQAAEVETESGTGVREGQATPTDPGTAIEVAPWVAGGEAHEWLDPQGPETIWDRAMLAVKSRPGDSSLALAVVLLAITLLWTFWPGRTNASLANARPPVLPTVKRKPRPKPPKLTLFEEAMVGLGLATPPPTPEYMGDPNIKVWEDLQTALYYCPDMDLYGTTEKGRYTTQAEAQQDAFESASRKPCD